MEMENCWCAGQNNLPLAPGPGPQNGLRDSPRPRPRGALVLGLKLSRDHSRNPESRSRVSVPMRANANAPKNGRRGSMLHWYSSHKAAIAGRNYGAQVGRRAVLL